MLASTLFGYSKDWLNNHKVISRVIHAPNDLSTSFDLKGHNFRIDVEFATYYHGRTQNNIFRVKRLLSDIFQPKQQFIFRVLPKVPFFIWILGCRFRHWIIHNCLLLFKDMLLTWHLFQGIFNWKYEIQIQLKLVNLVHSKISISGP